ncbi:membrane protein [Salmonella enterica subsp. arizonae]|uniref:Membrane protein n=1 Tax=Salmonella enterica subsp. arizonae TaxID=59203 RepID=A0A3S4K7U6_SALER|nr:membrane protein [Salmonella enterica subsp. arizonae]
MRLKIKEHITLWRNEGLIAYVTLGFLCTFFYGGQALLPYYLQQSIFFETLMHYMAFNTLFSLALCEIFLRCW